MLPNMKRMQVCMTLYVSSYYYICVLILLSIRPHTTIYVSSYYYMCPHTTIYTFSYRDEDADPLVAALLTLY
jgi:hypothetical protein